MIIFFSVKEKKCRGYTLIGLILALLLVGIFLTVLAPNFFVFQNQLKRYVDSNCAKNIASAVYAIQTNENVRPTDPRALVFSGYLKFNPLPYYPGAVAFEIHWENAEEFYIIEVDNKGKEIGDILYP